MPKPFRQEPDPNNKLLGLIKNDLTQFIGTQINCHTIGRVVGYDTAHRRANIQPLPLKSNGQTRAVLINCIVPASIYVIDEKESLNLMRIGAIVLVGFLDRDNDNWHGATNFKLASQRLHSIQDPVIESVIS
ncbi:hypothetical protein IV37_GL000195 [Fructilactobacillus fructivorans]|uniref:hypothetical protein n=1 Tax=Fructilactobacillus fructivorans TaxID=1614 RepID=UPI000704E9E4|nr:hypothetical protein [Fructilactobacillus fructivorans]KRN13473.1 hypothetical protein IV37_GL000195 [Fructilactobacillus fructivorans]